MAKTRKAKKRTKKALPANSDTKVTTVPALNRARRRAWILSGISIISVAFVVFGYWLITESVPVAFTSKLTQIGDIDLSYGERQSTKVSPLCGCYDIGEWENWRGITFSSRHLVFQRTGDLPITGFLLFAPSPAPTRIYPDFFKMKVTYYLISLEKSEQFNPAVLFSSKLPENYGLIEKSEGDEGFVQMLSHGKLHISLLGDKPIGAWIPMEKSDVSLTYEMRREISAPVLSTIRENYLASTEEELNRTWDENGFYDETKMSMPLADLLGPKVVFWNEEEPTTVLASTKVLHVPRHDAGKKWVKVVVVDPPFAVRAVAIPFNNDAMLWSTAEAPKRKENDYSPLTSQGRFDSGQASLEIYTSGKQSKDFERAYQAMKEQGTTVSDYKTYYSTKIAGGKMVFRYPPIPPNNGFNIFGKIDLLRLDSAMGNLLIGSRSFNIEAPASLELRRIQRMEVRNGVMEVPVEIGTSESSTSVQLRATSEVYVNNESITRRIDNNKTLFDYVLLATTILGTALAVISALFAAKSFLIAQHPNNDMAGVREH